MVARPPQMQFCSTRLSRPGRVPIHDDSTDARTRGFVITLNRTRVPVVLCRVPPRPLIVMFSPLPSSTLPVTVVRRAAG